MVSEHDNHNHPLQHNQMHHEKVQQNLCKTATLKKTKLVFKTNYRLMQVKSIAKCSQILTTFIKLPFVIKIFILSVFESDIFTHT